MSPVRAAARDRRLAASAAPDPPGSPPPLLEARAVSLLLGGRAIVRDVSLALRAGEVLVVLGPNGSGKTSLLRLLAGVVTPGSGEVLLQGARLRRLSPRQRALRLAYLPQLNERPAGFGALGLVEMGRYPHFDELASARAVASLRALGLVGAAHLAGRALHELSGGELQKVFLASVVAQDAPVLVLDEPTVFLDPGRAAEIHAVLLRLAGERRSVVLATHDVELAARAATRVLALREGRVQIDGPPADALRPAALRDLYGLPAGGEGGGAVATPPLRLVPWAGEAADARAEPPAVPRRASGRGLVVLVAGCVLALIAAPFAGPALDTAAPQTEGAAHFILWQLRVPRVLLAAVAGAALALAGATFQALFRNPLATPYTLGVASGAAFGAVAASLAGLRVPIAGLPGSAAGALAGATAITAAVYGLGRRRGALPTTTLLLAGVALSFFFSALILLLQSFAGHAETLRLVRWLMGEVRIVGYAPLALLSVPATAGAWLLVRRRAELDLLLTGEELAQARGVDVERLKRFLFLGSALLVGSVVAFCGPVGFVGLVVPHVLRLLLGPENRRLLPACIPAGAAFLVACDTVARLALAPAELPVGVLTALLGGPFFLLVLLRRGRRAEG
ncbi:MAG: iron chelate uptake ABC transporter family permease subunit [Gemmatimonadota bacterium]